MCGMSCRSAGSVINYYLLVEETAVLSVREVVVACGQ